MRLLAFLLSVMVLPGARPSSAESPPRMTTDSREYCDHLAREMVKISNRRPKPAPYVRHLADEGMRMCDRGMYRGGVARLRRALILMRTAE